MSVEEIPDTSLVLDERSSINLHKQINKLSSYIDGLYIQLSEMNKRLNKPGALPSHAKFFNLDAETKSGAPLATHELHALLYNTLSATTALIHYTAIVNGFWVTRKSPNIGEKIALMHSELSEALEAARHNNPEGMAEELADTIIRILDFCAFYNIDVSREVLRKMEINANRPFRHGKKF